MAINLKLVKNTGPVKMRERGTNREHDVPTRVTWDKEFEYRLEIGGQSVGYSGAILLRGIIDEYLRTDYHVEGE